MSRPRVSIDDLRLARDWLRAYQDGEETGDESADDALHTMQRVAAWLDAEIERRREDRDARVVMRDARRYLGKDITHAEALAALQRARKQVRKRLGKGR